MSNLPERLRDLADLGDRALACDMPHDAELMREAADKIERLCGETKWFEARIRESALPPGGLDTLNYRRAPSGEGPQAAEWKDKPHRLVYDLCGEIERLRGLNQCVSCPTDQPDGPYNAILCRECAGGQTDEIERLREALGVIVSHQATIGGSFAILSATRRMAQDALDYQATTQQEKPRRISNE